MRLLYVPDGEQQNCADSYIQLLKMLSLYTIAFKYMA